MTDRHRPNLTRFGAGPVGRLEPPAPSPLSPAGRALARRRSV